ncbi:MAG: autotransporter-associated beta strand repeat-containing protein [Phycisphaerae bacterium]
MASAQTTITKGNNANALDLGTSWVGGTPPGASNIALWDSTVTGANLTGTFSANATWQGIVNTNTTGALQIGPASVGGGNYTLMLGASGIDASTSNQVLNLYAPITLGANQTWSFGTSASNSSIGSSGSGTNFDTNGFTLTINNGSVMLRGNLIGSGNLTKTGTGQLGLAGTNTYAGKTTVDGGTISLTGTILSTSEITSTNNGTFSLDRTGTYSFDNTISGNAKLFKGAATGNATLTGANTYTNVTTIAAGILSVSSLNSVGTGHVTSSNLGAPTTVAGGTIEIGWSTTSGQLTYTGTGETTDRVVRFGSTSSSIGTGTGGATLDQSGTNLLKFTSNFANPGFAGKDERKTLTLQGSTAGTGEISGTITDSVAGTAGQLATSVTKAGTGTWTLSGANTYTGATTVSAGTLLISGTLAGTSGVTVSGGTLQLGAAERINNSATLTLSGGALNVGGFSETLGALALTNATASSLDFASGASILLFAGITSDTGTLAISNWTSGSDSLRFTSNVNLLASSFTVNGGAATILNQGSYFEVVPEPATWALLAFSLTAIMVLRRRMS